VPGYAKPPPDRRQAPGWSFTACGETVVLTAAGSAWTATAARLIGARLTVDGREVGRIRIWANKSSCYMTLVPVTVPFELAAGSHTVSVERIPGDSDTVTDVNDFFSVSLLEVAT
jgi:hypothetical protein